MPPAAGLRPPSTVHTSELLDHAALSPSAIMRENIPRTAGMQPFLVVGLSLIAFIVLLMIALIFSFWQLRRQQKLLATSRVPPSDLRPGNLYYRRARRKQPAKRVRWQSVVFHDSPPSSATSATHLLLNDERFRPIKTNSRPIYGTASTRRQIVDTPPPYTIRDISRFPTTPYRDMPATATTIDSQPMSDTVTPPPVPKKSTRRPAPLTLIVVSPTDGNHGSSAQTIKRELTPYPLAGQLTPADEDSSSPRSSTFADSPPPITAATVRPKLKLKIGNSLSPLDSHRKLRMLSPSKA